MSPCTPSRPASYFKRGQAAEAREDYDAAYDNYLKAYTKAPKDLRYRAALYRVRVSDSSLHLTKGRKLLEAGNEQGALAEFLRAAEIDPGNEAAQQEIARVRSCTARRRPSPRLAFPRLPASRTRSTPWAPRPS